MPDVYCEIILLGSTTLGKDRKQEVGQLCTHKEAATILVGRAGMERTLQESPAAVCLVSIKPKEMNAEHYLPQSKRLCCFLTEKEAFPNFVSPTFRICPILEIIAPNMMPNYISLLLGLFVPTGGVDIFT